MPAPSDIRQFMHGQIFQTPTLPQANLEGKIVAITGANQGLGFWSAKQMFVSTPSHESIVGC